MKLPPGSRRYGRRAALLAAIGAAAVAALAAPAGVTWLRETYAIHQLASKDDAVVREGIATLVRLKSDRGAKRIFELAAEMNKGTPDSSKEAPVRSGATREKLIIALAWEALRSLPLPDDFIVERAQSRRGDERILAVKLIGEKRISGAIPLLRKMAAETGPDSARAVVALAQVLPTVKLLKTETTTSESKARFRFQNLTGHGFSYHSSPGPNFNKVVRGTRHWGFPEGTLQKMEPQAFVDFEATFTLDELPGAVEVFIQGGQGGSGFVRSETVNAPQVP